MKILGLFLLILGSNAYPQTMKTAPNSCLINSIRVYENISAEFKHRNIWHNVLAFTYIDRTSNSRQEQGHAITVFYWENKYFVYDINKGSFIVETQYNIKRNPVLAAKVIYPEYYIISAEYMARK